MKKTPESAWLAAQSSRSLLISPSPLISDETMRRMQERLLRCGVSAESKRSRAAGACGVASLVGATLDLQARDTFVGAVPAALEDELRSASVKLIGGISGLVEKIAMATGLALAHGGNAKVSTVVVFLKGNLGEVLSAESLQLARAHALPILYVLDAIEGEGAPLKRIRNSSRKTAIPDEIPVIPVDGNDVIATYRVAHESITRARRGGGPTMMECKRSSLLGA